MPDRCVLMRHGQSFANVASLIASHPSTAGEAYGLTLAGSEEVRRSVARARSAGVLAGTCRVVSSPLLRARESAAVAALILGADVVVDERLTERDFGPLELTADRNYERVWAQDRRDPREPPSGVESAEAVWRRALDALEDARRTAREETIMLCTHGDVASILYCGCLGRPLGRHREVGALLNAELRVLPPSPVREAVDPAGREGVDAATRDAVDAAAREALHEP